jgi:hypothetical protein
MYRSRYEITANRVLAALWLAFVVFLSFAPVPVKDTFFTRGVAHTSGHFIAFLSAALLLATAEIAPRAVVCGTTIALALLLEVLQVAIYHNHFEYRDLLIDAAGATFGCLTARVLKSRAGRRGMIRVRRLIAGRRTARSEFFSK